MKLQVGCHVLLVNLWFIYITEQNRIQVQKTMVWLWWWQWSSCKNKDINKFEPILWGIDLIILAVNRNYSDIENKFRSGTAACNNTSKWQKWNIKQCRSRPDHSFKSSLIWVWTVGSELSVPTLRTSMSDGVSFSFNFYNLDICLTCFERSYFNIASCKQRINRKQ